MDHSDNSAAGSNIQILQWIVLAVVIVMICIMGMIVAYLLWRRRKKLYVQNQKNAPENVELQYKPPTLVRDQSSSEGSRDEGMEGQQENGTAVTGGIQT